MVPFIDESFVEEHTNFIELGENLRQAFASDQIVTPQRHHHDFKNPKEGIDSTLLLMPAWDTGIDLGVKIVSVSPNNGKYNLPSIQGTYLYMDGHTGEVKAIFDAKCLTAKRTAAVSALASSYLSRQDASTLLMIGTGALSGNLIQAHSAFRKIKRVFIWGRDLSKAKKVADLLGDTIPAVEVLSKYEKSIKKVDIISCATLSSEPLIQGDLLQKGQHLDLVGSYKTDMREADDQCILRSSLFLDTYQGGLRESGDIVIPIEKGLINKQDIKADLHELCSDKKTGRINLDEITLFKSVGHASEDLVAARYYYNKYMENQ